MNSNWVNVYFRPGSDEDLMTWVKQCGRANFGLFGREAFTCYRLFGGSLAQAQEAAVALNFMRERYGENWQEELVK